MPTFDFVCGKCKERFEVLLRSEKQKVVCRKCGSRKVAKQVTSFGMNLGAAQPKGFGKNGSICGCGASGCAPCSAGL